MDEIKKQLLLTLSLTTSYSFFKDDVVMKELDGSLYLVFSQMIPQNVLRTIMVFAANPLFNLHLYVTSCDNKPTICLYQS